MHRFGRSAQRKMNDRWGGGFILATILALAAAWYAGDLLGRTAGTPADGPPMSSNQPGGGQVTVNPEEFSVYFVRVGLFDFDANASKMLKKVSDQNYPAVMGPKNNKGWSPVYAGPFTSEQSAKEAKAKLEQALSKDVKSTVMETVVVPQHTNVVATSTAAGAAAGELQKGMDLLNSYLHEVSTYLEARVSDPNADATGVTAYGQELAAMATAMAGEKDSRVAKFVDMANRASANAMGLTASIDGTDQIQQAVNDYMLLMRDYRSFK